MDCIARQAPLPSENTGVDCYFLLQGILPTQGWNWSLLHWRADYFFTTESPGKPRTYGEESKNHGAGRLQYLKPEAEWYATEGEDFRAGTVDERPPANAEDTGSASGPGSFHLLEGQLLSPCSRAFQLQLLSPRAATTEACVLRACA